MYKTILVPIDMAHMADGNSIIDVAIEHAAESTEIVLLNVVEDIPGWAANQLSADIIDNSLEHVSNELKAIANASARPIEVAVRTGHSYNTILKVAKELKADLIIIASHHPGMQDYFIGSTASKVVRHASCSVLVVR